MAYSQRDPHLIAPCLADRIELAIAKLQATVIAMFGKPISAIDLVPGWNGILRQRDQAQEDAEDGLAPERVMKVMEGLLRNQERRARAGPA